MSSKASTAGWIVAISLAAANVALLRHWHESHRGTSHVAVGEDPSEKLAALQREVEELRGEIVALRTAVAISRWRNATGFVAPPAAPLENTPPEPAPAAATVDETPEFMATLETTFRQEPVDGGWSSKVSDSLKEILSGKDVQLLPRAIECRSHTCRVEAVVRGIADPALVSIANQRLVLDLPNMVINHELDEAGRTVAILYLSRGDHDPTR